MAIDFRLAVKAFIVKDDAVLLLRRRSDDVHKPADWDIPGGRLELGEDPFAGLQREVKEETGLDIEIKMPLEVHHFTRDDGQKITMITFLCKPLHDNIKLSEEHTEWRWQKIDEKESFPGWLQKVVLNYWNLM